MPEGWGTAEYVSIQAKRHNEVMKKLDVILKAIDGKKEAVD